MIHAPRVYAWCRAARHRTALTPPIAFHAAPPAARTAIAAEGLDTVQRRQFAEIMRPEAVFLWGTLIDALYDSWGHAEIWAVSVDGLTLSRDPNDDWGWMVAHAIGPARLQWLGAPPPVSPGPTLRQWAARRGWPPASLVGAPSHTPSVAVP